MDWWALILGILIGLSCGWLHWGRIPRLRLAIAEEMLRRRCVGEASVRSDARPARRDQED